MLGLRVIYVSNSGPRSEVANTKTSDKKDCFLNGAYTSQLCSQTVTGMQSLLACNALVNFTNAFSDTVITLTESCFTPITPPSAAYMRQRIGSELVQIAVCGLFDARSLPGPMLPYCQLDSWEHISVKFESNFYHFHSSKCK